MWLCALVSVAAAFHEAQSQLQLRPSNMNPLAISNIELLIQNNLAAGSREADYSSGEERDSESEERYSSIPAYAFKLDPEMYSPRASTKTVPAWVKNRSRFLAQLWPAYAPHAVPDAAHEASGAACRQLASQQPGAASELMLYLCNEVIDLLAARCACDADHVHRARPLFGPPGGRRQSENIKPKNRISL